MVVVEKGVHIRVQASDLETRDERILLRVCLDKTDAYGVELGDIYSFIVKVVLGVHVCLDCGPVNAVELQPEARRSRLAVIEVGTDQDLGSLLSFEVVTVLGAGGEDTKGGQYVFNGVAGLDQPCLSSFDEGVVSGPYDPNAVDKGA